MQPPRILLYGPSKIGISSFCAQIPKAYFMDVNGTIGHLDVNAARCRTVEDCQNVLQYLTAGNHDYKVLVIDSLDGLEVLVQNEVFANEKEKLDGLRYFAEIPYGRGSDMVISEFRDLLEDLDDLNKKMTIIVCAHETMEDRHMSFSGPMSFAKPYMYTKTVKGQKISEEASNILTTWADCVLYVSQKNHVKGGFFSKDKGKTLNDDPQERSIYTDLRPTFYAGNRYGLPYEIDFKWESLREELYKKFTKKEEM
jgi:hypothetical protein